MVLIRLYSGFESRIADQRLRKEKIMADWERIAEYMKTHKGITCKECEKEIGTTELRKRICELKDKGYGIIDVWEEGTNRVGITTRYKRYFLVTEPGQFVVEKLKK